MSRRRATVRAAALACWGLAIVPGVSATFGQEAASATLDAAGWWNKSQAVPTQVEQAPTLAPAPLPVTAITVPAPPTAPEDGLYVANEASGPAAVSAVRYLGSGDAGGTLTLQVAGEAPATGAEELAACPLPGGFTPVQNGRWDAAPVYEPSTCTIDGTFAEDGKSVAFALDASFVSTLGDIQAIIVPKPGSATPFQMGFAKPDNSSMVPSGGAVGGSEMPAFDSGAALDSGFSSSPSFDAPASGTDSFATPAFDAPTTDVAAPVDSAPVADAAPAQQVAAAPAKAVSESRAAQIMAVVVLLAIGAAFWWLASQPDRAPRLLGSLGGAARATAAALPTPAAATAVVTRSRGVGRFARPRTQPPTPI